MSLTAKSIEDESLVRSVDRSTTIGNEVNQRRVYNGITVKRETRGSGNEKKIYE